MNDLEKALHEQKKATKVKKIYGILGIPLGGQKIVEVANREGFVWVRLRDNQSELIQAVNSEVSPVYDLPVVLIRQGNRYVIEGRDTERYQNWGSSSSFLPRHGEQHSFSEGNGGGGDVVWVYGKQFMPMLVMPSGSLGSNNVVVSDYRIQKDTTGWIYSGGTGTANLLQYKPLNSNAVMILVYVDQTTGNPGFIVGSGSYFANTITGSAQVNPYIPAVPNSNYLPAMAVRLSSGTSVIGWDNLYDVRQYYGGSGGASTGSSSGLPPFITGSVPFAGSDGILKEENNKFFFDEQYTTLWIGKKFPLTSPDPFRLILRATGSSAPAAMGIITAGTGTSGGNSPVYGGYRSRGTFEVPTAVSTDDILANFIGAGHDGTQYINSAAIRMFANTSFVGGVDTASRIGFGVTPSGSNTRIDKMVLYGDSVNLINTGTYNVNGIPHSHTFNQLGLTQQNYLANSDFTLFQRLTATGTFNTIADKAYGPDQWWSSRETGTVQYIKLDATGETLINTKFYGQYKKVTSAGKIVIVQPLEGQTSVSLRGETVTFQIMMKSSGTNNIRMAVLELQNAGTIDAPPATLVTAFGANTVDPTFGANVAIITGAQTKVVTNTWQQFSVTVTVPSNSKNLFVALWSDSQYAVNDVLSLAEAGLYKSSGVVPWAEQIDGTDLARCRRYYWKTFALEAAVGQNVGINTAEWHFPAPAAGAVAQRGAKCPFPVEMFKPPTYTSYNPAGTNAEARDITAGADCSAFTFGVAITNGIIYAATGAAGTAVGNALRIHLTAEAPIL